MPEEYDIESFRPGSNLKEDFDGTITAAAFEKSENAQNYACHMVIMGDDGEEVEGFYGCGSDWVSYDGGASVEHPKGASHKFNNQTAYAEFNVFAMVGFEGDVNDPNSRPLPWPKGNETYQGPGALKVLSERNRAANGRGPQIASTWVGLRFHFDVITRKTYQRKVTKNADGSETTEWLDSTVERMLPTRFLGLAGGSVGSSVTTPAQPVAQPAPQPAQPVAGQGQAAPQPAAQPAPDGGASSYPALADLPIVDRAAVIQLARTLPFDQFIDRVMGLQVSSGGDMLGQAKVIQALADETMYNALRG